ncbi:hypothetical protein CEXT_814451, partial [Caerostris extrusa]
DNGHDRTHVKTYCSTVYGVPASIMRLPLRISRYVLMSLLIYKEAEETIYSRDYGKRCRQLLHESADGKWQNLRLSAIKWRGRRIVLNRDSTYYLSYL